MAEAMSGVLRKRYTLLDLIGRGGTASVYRGRDEALSRDVAVKLYPPAVDRRDAQRQEDEVSVLASLSHHGLVTLLDAGMERVDDDRKRVYIVMELVDGIDLQQTIGLELPTPRDIANIGYDIAEALLYVHNRGVVHRDVKPSNILMVDYRDDGARVRAKLTDFGIAHLGTSNETDAGVTTGTAAYLSPEQVRRDDIGPASDVYSLGLVLLECFTGELAFPGDAVPSALARLDGAPGIPAAISPEWRSVLSAMTATDPSDRPTAGQLVGVLRNLVNAETGRHKGASAIVDEPARAAAVGRYDFGAIPAVGPFDRVTRLAGTILNAPIAIVTFADAERSWFTAQHDALEVAGIDPAALADPFTASALGLQFCASVPLLTPDGTAIGTLSVLDFRPRIVAESELAILEELAGVVMDELDLRIGTGGQ